MVPETERLDTSAHRAKGLLAQKAGRQPPSRSKLKESLALTSNPSQVSQQQLKVTYMLVCRLQTKVLCFHNLLSAICQQIVNQLTT